MKLGPQNRVWASQAKTFKIDYVGKIGDQIDVALTIGDNHLIVGRNGGIPKQSGRKGLENHLAVHRLQNAASPKLVYGRKTGNSRDGRMSERYMKHRLGERCVHLGAELLRENIIQLLYRPSSRPGCAEAGLDSLRWVRLK